MNISITITPSELSHFLWHTALVRPVFIWGPPGIGKSSLVQQFAEEVGLPCISLLGCQLAPEDLIGMPQIIDGKRRFCPPTMIAREEPYCLFLDELNACSYDVQKAFYSLVLDKRIGEYHMPNGSMVIGAGNRAEDSAIVKPMASALINRMVHVQLKSSHRDWLAWAERADIHPWIMDYIKTRPDHLWSKPPKHEAPFSTPRGWHILSDVLRQYNHAMPESVIEVLAFGCVSPEHAGQFKSFIKQVRHKYALNDILNGDVRWPEKPEDRDVLYFLAQSFRAHLVRELPEDHHQLNHHQKAMVIRAKARLKDLALISLEMAQMVVANGDDSRPLPDWLLVEIVRDLPRLAQKR